MTLWGSQAATLSQVPAAVTSAAATPTAASTASRPGLHTRTATIMPRSARPGASGVAAAQRERRGGGQDEDPGREPGHRGARAEALRGGAASRRRGSSGRYGTVCRVTASGVILSASSGSTSRSPNMLVIAAAALRTRTPVNKPIRPAAVM